MFQSKIATPIRFLPPYLEIQCLDALEQATEDEAHFTLGDLQRQGRLLRVEPSVDAVVASLRG